ncbi:NAD-dependent epimerase/dehydratase family protein [Listeria rocourtiae]|uniref:NAD-dependent epimerase/dehydratase family protein n=1 Tax=Listeria rocourtiae TaxID=647910 RepID=UPI0016236181|nr:NAD-dependent epimerase/dehydratase family protein [Listeria rocourtiae]MBC1605520.1 NAD-dependent epimerase/dehydratase family protein [Listeria rocourtiae]
MRILVTGKQGYVGTQFEHWMAYYYPEVSVDLISVREPDWEAIDFSQYDTILHAAALVHRKENAESAGEYHEINTELTEKLAFRAKIAGVKHFVFLSTVAVYGEEGSFEPVGKTIDIDQTPFPTSLYGKSKYEAEKRLHQLESPDFKVAIVRPPMIYGPNCPGNYSRLAKLARKSPIFPAISGSRSMLFIDNLSAFLQKIMCRRASGVYVPQNQETVNTTQLVQLIAEVNGGKMLTSKLVGRLCKKILRKHTIFKKTFGNLVFEMDKTITYRAISFSDSIWKTENKEGVKAR